MQAAPPSTSTEPVGLAKKTSAESPLPQHDAFSLPRRIFSALSISAAVGLLIWNSVHRLACVETFHWWLPVAVLGGMILADILSGLVHWGADTWGSESMPVVGRRLLHPFRVHHVNPSDFIRRRFIDTNGDVAFLVIPILIGALMLPRDAGWGNIGGIFLIAFCAVGLMTNQVHQWAHMPQPPLVVRVLQDWGLILSREAHQRHHLPPYTASYCIATGWCNRPLTAIGFFRRLERLVTWVTGCQPRGDDAVFGAPYARGADRNG